MTGNQTDGEKEELLSVCAEVESDHLLSGAVSHAAIRNEHGLHCL